MLQYVDVFYVAGAVALDCVELFPSVLQGFE